jgi:Type I phosphodiesterase / nucleotide pyrophosphatase
MLRRTKQQVDDALARITGPGVRHLLRPLSRRGRLRPGSLESGRRLILVQLDGVSRGRLEWAMRTGHMPFLARRLERGESALSSARSGAPASTPAFQAGLLYGVSPSVPGFVWYDRHSRREIRMDRASDAAAQEARLSARNPPLLRGGTSYFSIFSGGAALPHFCLSGLAGDARLDALTEGFSGWDAAASAIVHSFTAVRAAGRLAHELAVGAWQGAAWSLTLGRWKHEPRFLLHRLLVGALMREIAVQGIIIDVARAVPIVYCDLIGFDEYAHRRGPDSPEALGHLRSMDLALAAVFAAVEAVPELRYDVYVFSDHGHVATTPFESYTGLSLPEYLALADGGIPLPERLGGEEAVRLAQTRSLRASLSAWPAFLRSPVALGLDRIERRVIGHALGFVQNERVVTAEAGDLAHVYFTDERTPIGLEEVRARHPGVLSALRESRAVGIVAARQGRRGVALTDGQELDLADPADVRRLRHPEPGLLATYLSDLLSLEASGDLIVLGWRGEGRPPVAYAWEFGSHGGVAPEEIDTFFLHPPRCGLKFGEALRPDALYRMFHHSYREPARRERPRGQERPWIT